MTPLTWITLLLLSCGAARTPDSPAEPSATLADAMKEFRAAKCSRWTWRYEIGVSSRPDHVQDKLEFMQEYEVEVRERLLTIPHLQLFRLGDRGAFQWQEQWRPLQGHMIGRWFVILLDYPESLLVEAKRGALSWVEPPKEERGEKTRLLRSRLSRKRAQAYFANVQKSGCMSGRHEAMSGFLDKVDTTRIAGHVDVELAGTKVKRILLVVLVGRTGERDVRKPLAETEHVLVRAEMRFHSFAELEPIEIPAEARKFMEKK